MELGIGRGISFGLFGPPETFMPRVRDLGAGLVRVFFFWSQIEPTRGDFSWEAVDAFLEQLEPADRVWVTVCSSSTWATQQESTFLPPSPAKEEGDYDRFVRALVTHCAGRVHYWQCDNEPCNTPLLWAGTAEEYVSQLKIFHNAVKDIDRGAEVVLGGAPYALPSGVPEDPERQFFDVLLDEGRDHFDLFDLHLYGEVDNIPADVEAARDMMRKHGYLKPIVVGEFGGPGPYNFPAAMTAFQPFMMEIFQGSEKAAMEKLYAQTENLPTELRMFMEGCSVELADRRDRLHSNETVARCLLALSAGIESVVCWQLGPEVPNYTDPFTIMDLFYGKLGLMRYRDSELTERKPAADAYALMADHLAGAEKVTKLDADCQLIEISPANLVAGQPERPHWTGRGRTKGRRRSARTVVLARSRSATAGSDWT